MGSEVGTLLPETVFLQFQLVVAELNSVLTHFQEFLQLLRTQLPIYSLIIA